MTPHPRLDDELRRRTRFGRLVHVASCASTQDLAAEQDLADPADLIVWADHQTHGRGRQRRAWDDTGGLDLAVTFRVRADLPNPVALPAALPVAVLDACEPMAGKSLRIKWPNDVYAGGQKLSGVLVDRDSDRPEVYRIGVGVNVNRLHFPPELDDKATSLRLLAGHELDRSAALLALAESVDEMLHAISADGDDRAHLASFRERLGLMHREVTVTAGRTMSGTLTDINFDRLVLNDSQPVPLAIVTGLAAKTP
ncbi:MAG: biotin--[acetyl-CoA-carboxylase] ligase [Planctomycetota bacterium]|nr:biotin--[acetyl-CoA-carboxylase] ligase [Planctomycetota bacterium]